MLLAFIILLLHFIIILLLVAKPDKIHFFIKYKINVIYIIKIVWIERDLSPLAKKRNWLQPRLEVIK